MKSLIFAKRNFKELLRDPLGLVFCIGLPLVLLLVFMQFNIPNNVYKIENFTPSIIIFGFGFISLFSGLLIAQDRTSSFLTRLYASPLTSFEFILGYSLSLIPIALIQSILFFGCALALDLIFSINIIYCILILVPISILFIGIGILLGSCFSDKSVSGVTSLLINFMTFTSGMWFDISMIGATFRIISKILPFYHCVEIARGFLSGNYAMFSHLAVVFIYIIVIYIIAIIVFNKKMKQ